MSMSSIGRLRGLSVIASIAGLSGFVSGCNDGRGADADAEGETEGDSADDAGDSVGPLCNEGDPSPTPLRRLTVREYENTLEDLLGGDSLAVQAGAGFIAELPADGDPDHWFSNADLRLGQRHVDAYYQVADAVANAVAEHDDELVTLAGECALAGALDTACLETFISDFGLRAFRRPLEDDEIAIFAELAEPSGPGRDAYRDVLFTMLMSPDFLYVVETHGTPIGGREDLLALTPWEIASRLSYHFWQSMPDDELFAAAADGSLATNAGYEAQVERMLEGSGRERSREAFRMFYDEWFGLDTLTSLGWSPPLATLAEGLPLEDPSSRAALRTAMMDEVRALTDHFTWEVDGSFADMLTTDLSFTTDPVLASIYGVEPWTGTGEHVRMPTTERSGLLTRAAFLVSGDHKTAPMHRGIHVLRDVMCAGPPPPPADLPEDALEPPVFDPDLTTRERYELKTAAGECQACHASFNPIGFAQESYDALGRWRTTEVLIDDDGSPIGELPLDTSVTIPGLVDGAPDVDGPVELMALVVDSGRIDGCFARHYFQYTHRRKDSVADQCLIDELEEVASETGSVQAVLRTIALQPEFRVRRAGEEEGGQ
jgi:hypothetical protein